MKDFVLYTSALSPTLDPVRLLVRLYRVFCDLKELTYEPSAYWWNGAGDLPVLRYGACVFPKDRILDFLKLTFDLDFDLPQREKLQSELLQELCVSALHPATVAAMEQCGSLLSWDTLTWPLWLAERIRRKFITKWFLQRHHYLVSPEEALRKVEETHAALSEWLGLQPFFFASTSPRPRSADLVVYAYLKSEATNLPETHPHLHSLRKYPNLTVFMEKMDDLVLMIVDPEHAKGQKRMPLLCDRKEPDYARLKAISGTEQPARWLNDDGGLERRGYVTGTCAILFLFLFFKGSN